MTYCSIFRAGLFAGQTIIVTGAGSGIGRAVAHELATLGAFVALAGRTVSKLEKVHDEITAVNGQSAIYQYNQRHEDQIAHLIQTVLADRGVIHGLVNNAGGQFLSPAEHLSLKGWHAVIETNLTGTFLLCREVFNQHMCQHGGVIVNMLIEMWRGFPGMAHSAAARAGIDNLTKTLAVEWAKAGVRINAVAPGIIDSTGLERYGESMRPILERIAEDVPLKRLGTESEVASTIVFLLSPAAAYISGESIRIDGASSLWRKTWEIDSHDKAPVPYNGFDGQSLLCNG